VGIAFDPLKTKNHHQTFGEKEKKMILTQLFFSAKESYFCD